MEHGLNLAKAAPAAYSATLTLEGQVAKLFPAEPLLLKIVKMRASQINGCAYCLDMHSNDARAKSE